jgi:hypothetical protein
MCIGIRSSGSDSGYVTWIYRHTADDRWSVAEDQAFDPTKQSISRGLLEESGGDASDIGLKTKKTS